MALMYEMTEQQRSDWDNWISSRPKAVQDLARRFPPNKLFRLKSSGHRVYLYSYFEDGTLTVVVDGKYNMVAFERKVFGIKPEALEECELPASDEVVGSMNLTPEQVKKMMGE
jgi:hypothetical protein